MSNDTFGPLVAYLIPGVTVLFGVSPYSATLQSWLAVQPEDAPTIAGFLYVTVASLAAGMTVNALRWAIVDTIHRYTGIPPPLLKFSGLSRKVEAFALLIEIHFRHYQYFGNMFVACAIGYGAHRWSVGSNFLLPKWSDLVFFLLEIVFFIASRDTLQKYYARTRQLLNAQS